MERKIVSRMMLILLIASIVIVLDSPILVFAQTNSTTTVYLDPPTINGTAIGVNNTITVNINISNAIDVHAWQAGLNFNPTLLECTGFFEGEFLKNVGATYWIQGTINNTAGEITPHGCTLLGDYKVSGSGRLAYLTFKVKAPGVSDLHFRDVKVIDHDLNMVPVNIIDVYTVVLDTTPHTIVTVSNSTGQPSGFSGHAFSMPDKEVSFNVTGPHPGFSNVTIPKTLLSVSTLDEWTVLIDDLPVSRTVTYNGTHYSIYFTYTSGIHKIQIVGMRARIYVDPLISYAGVGETFSVNVRVADVSNLYGFEFKLGYNTIFLDAVDVVIQPFLNEPTYVFREEINDEYNATFGFVWVAVTSEYPAEEVSGGGALATVTFRVMGLGGCALDLYDTKLSDPDGSPIDHSVEDGYYESGMTRVVSTESTLISYMPSLAVDHSGNVHVAWHDYSDYLGCGTDADIFYKKFVPGSGWTSTEVVSTESPRDSYTPSLAVDSRGNIHVAWWDHTNYAGCGTDTDIFYKKFVPGSGWTSTEVVSTNSTRVSWCPSLAVDHSGNVHVAWKDYSDYLGCGTDVDIFYKRYEVGSNWTFTEVVSTNSTDNSSGPSLAVDHSGNVHVAWCDYTNYTGCGTDADIFYKRYEVGSNWTFTEVVSTNSTDNSSGPSLAVDSRGNIHVAWKDYSDYLGCGTDVDIFYKKFVPGSGWTSTEVVSTESTSTSSYPSLAVDHSGNVHVAWCDYTNYTGCGTDADIFYKRYEVGSNWTFTEVVSTESTDHSSIPSLTVDLARNVHIAWQDDTNYAGCGTDTDIFYKYLCLHSTTYPWSMFHHNPRHTGYTESPAPRTNQTQWTYTTGGVVLSSPAVADGMVFVSSNDYNVYALDQHTGVHIWNYTTGDWVYSSPAVADGMVFVGSNDGKLYALNQYTGEHVWNYTTDGSVESSPAVADGKVYVGSYDGRVYCLDASTGAHIWNCTIGHHVVSSPAVADGKVYVGSIWEMTVNCLDALTGAYIWSYPTHGVVSSPAVADGKVYVGSYDRKVYCLDASTGAHVWNYTTDGSVESSPAVADGMVFVGSYDKKVYALDQFTGALIWNYTTGGGEGGVGSSPAVADGKVYVGSDDSKVYCLDAATGAHMWNYTTGDSVFSSPAVADGMVFIGSNDNAVYAFGNIVRVPEDYPTVEEAIEAADPGATIIVGPGTYYEHLVIDKPLTIMGRKGSPGPPFHGGGEGIAFNVTVTASGTNINNLIITDYEAGILLSNSGDCKIYNNTMSLMDYNGITIEGNNATNNRIYSNTITCKYNNTIAINLTESSTNNHIYNNTISSNNIGLNLVESSGNTIYENTISQNEVGINMSNSDNNTIYWNNFVDNEEQVSMPNSPGNAWDNGYPDGGNYWSDFKDRYPDVDIYRGPYQNETGSDGIFDTNYTIAENNIDRYPLVKPFSPHDIGITKVTTSKTIIGRGYNLNITVKIINYGIHNETFTVTAYANTPIMPMQTITLTRRNSTTITFTLNTTGVPYGNYTITANATIVSGETYTTDNTRACWFLVTVVGDVCAPYCVVNILDVGTVCSVYALNLYYANCDFDSDGRVTILDVGTVCRCFALGYHC